MDNRRDYKPVKRVSAQYVAAALGMTEQAVTRWARRGYLPGVQEGRRGTWSFARADVAEFAKSRAHLFARQLNLFESLQEQVADDAAQDTTGEIE